MDTTDPQDTLGRTMFGEARNQGVDGLTAIANVVMNRIALPDHPHFGHGDVVACCLAPWQFSCHNENDPNRALLESVDASDPIFAQCLDIAAQAVAGDLADLTDGATFYKVVGTHADWAEGQTPCKVIGRHEFYRGIA